MGHKRNEALRHVQHSMHHVIAAGEGSDRAPGQLQAVPVLSARFQIPHLPVCPLPL